MICWLFQYRIAFDRLLRLWINTFHSSWQKREREKRNCGDLMKSWHSSSVVYVQKKYVIHIENTHFVFPFLILKGAKMPTKQHFAEMKINNHVYIQMCVTCSRCRIMHSQFKRQSKINAYLVWFEWVCVCVCVWIFYITEEVKKIKTSAACACLTLIALEPAYRIKHESTIRWTAYCIFVYISSIYLLYTH